MKFLMTIMLLVLFSNCIDNTFLNITDLEGYYVNRSGYSLTFLMNGKKEVFGSPIATSYQEHHNQYSVIWYGGEYKVKMDSIFIEMSDIKMKGIVLSRDSLFLEYHSVLDELIKMDSVPFSNIIEYKEKMLKENQMKSDYFVFRK